MQKTITICPCSLFCSKFATLSETLQPSAVPHSCGTLPKASIRPRDLDPTNNHCKFFKEDKQLQNRQNLH